MDSLDFQQVMDTDTRLLDSLKTLSPENRYFVARLKYSGSFNLIG